MLRLYRGSNFPFLLLIFTWALQQCGSTALPVIKCTQRSANIWWRRWRQEGSAKVLRFLQECLKFGKHCSSHHYIQRTLHWARTTLACHTNIASKSGRILLTILCNEQRQTSRWKLDIFTALHVMQTRYCDEISVRPSVRPSVCPSHAWIVTKR